MIIGDSLAIGAPNIIDSGSHLLKVLDNVPGVWVFGTQCILNNWESRHMSMCYFTESSGCRSKVIFIRQGMSTNQLQCCILVLLWYNQLTDFSSTVSTNTTTPIKYLQTAFLTGWTLLLLSTSHTVGTSILSDTSHYTHNAAYVATATTILN